MIQKLLDLDLNLVLNSQHLTGLNVQEAEGVEVVENVVEFRLRECAFVIVLRLLEGDTGLRRERNVNSVPLIDRQGHSLLTT